LNWIRDWIGSQWSYYRAGVTTHVIRWSKVHHQTGRGVEYSLQRYQKLMLADWL